MNSLGNILSMIFVAIALCLVVWITVSFLKNWRRGDEPFGRKLGRYVRGIFDALWGAG